MIEQTLGYPYHRLPLSNIKKRMADPHKNLERSTENLLSDEASHGRLCTLFIQYCLSDGSLEGENALVVSVGLRRR